MDHTDPGGSRRASWRVGRLTAPNPSLETLTGTNSYLVGGGPKGCAIIDPGPDDPGHLDRLRALANRRGGARLILLTHGHHDHVAGAARLRARTGARILAFSRDLVPEADAVLVDQAVIRLGDTTLTALHTPGHAADHLCFHLPARRVLFAGDLVAGVGTVFIAPPDGDLGQYLDSLRRALALSLRRIFPGHGPTVTNPGSLLRGYLEHRAEREAQTLAALDSHESMGTIDDLITAVYADLEPARRTLAALQMRALLRKLEHDGKVRRLDFADGGARWHRVN
ncbi:MAG TPA: MBL fold metallo-hydrolase [Chloroflexota bacterium]